MVTELYPCKRCGAERFEVVAKRHHEFVIEDEPGRARIDYHGGTVGELVCSACGRVAITPDQLTEAEKDFLLGGKEATA